MCRKIVKACFCSSAYKAPAIIVCFFNTIQVGAGVLLFCIGDVYADSTQSILSQNIEQPIIIEAESLSFNAIKKELHAKGQVDVRQSSLKGIRQLSCELLIYYQSSGVIEAIGSQDSPVFFKDELGDEIFALKAVFSQSLDTGEIEKVTLKRVNNSVLHGRSLLRKSQTKTVITNVDYTACMSCKTRSPLWQLKAKTVEHDQASQMLEYQGVTMEIKGVPVFYIPYFAHPDPAVKKKSGFLIPSVAQNTDLGYIASLPYYYVINDQQDLTLTPTLTSKQSAIILGEYRVRAGDGYLYTTASYTQSQTLENITSSKNSVLKEEKTSETPLETDSDEKGSSIVSVTPLEDITSSPSRNRWHLSLKSEKEINECLKLLININRASDTTYLSRYALTRQIPFIQNNTNLRSSLVLQYFDKNTYGDIQAYAFQTDSQSTTPFILPKASWYKQEKMPFIGGVWTYNSKILMMFRNKELIGRSGTEMYRFSNEFMWRRPYVLPLGHLITLQASSRIDLYLMKNYFESINERVQKNSVVSQELFRNEQSRVRFFPQGSIEWQWPLFQRISFGSGFEEGVWLCTPKAMLVSSLSDITNKHIPNEDSLSFEVDELALFNANRFENIDRVDAGSRVVFGMENQLQWKKDRYIAVFVGQSVRLDNNENVVGYAKGEDSQKSDFFIKFKIKPLKYIHTRHRIAYSPHLKTIRVAENGVVLGIPAFKISLGHTYINKEAAPRVLQRVVDKDKAVSIQATPALYGISQLNFQISSAISENWSFVVGQIKNLKHSKTEKNLAAFASARYDDECFTFDFGVYKSSQRDRDIRPETAFLMRLNFKTLSSVTVSAAPSAPLSPLIKGLDE